MIKHEYFELLFTSPKKSDPLFLPFAEILTKQLSKGKTKKAPNKVITNDFAESKVDDIINNMISNLELIRKEAHKKFNEVK